MATDVNRLARLTAEVDAIRKISQDASAPDLKENIAILHRRGERFDAILALLHKHAVLLRQHGEGRTKSESRREDIEFRRQLAAIEERITALESRN